MPHSPQFYCRYYVGHKGKFGHEFLEFEFQADGKVRCTPCEWVQGIQFAGDKGLHSALGFAWPPVPCLHVTLLLAVHLSARHPSIASADGARVVVVHVTAVQNAVKHILAYVTSNALAI